jgi:hypothetical protein
MHLIIARTEPMHLIQPPTPESIADAKRANAQERAEVQRKTGLLFDEHGRLRRPVPQIVPFSNLPIGHRVDLQEGLDELVESYGFEEVWRGLTLIAAANGREL